jgi:predicted AlkP superfamily pyrophosphatase or phosphodiesterase
VPVFPALTFPNHYTIVTGLRPARHGIVSNVMRDPEIPGRFSLSDTAVTGDPRWWGGEPVWNAATRQGQKSATMFWPGSDVAIGGRFPTYWRQFDHNLPPGRRTDQVLEWLSLPDDERPSLVTLYYSDVDTAGHEDGPESPALLAAAVRLDHELGRLLSGVDALGLGQRVHWIVVSDHGMAAVAAERVIVLDDFLDPGDVDLLYVGAMLTLNPAAASLDAVYSALRGQHPHLQVYRSVRASTISRISTSRFRGRNWS